ncbi:AN1-type zinc finger protein 4 [Bonamia ostreae]|uniref:AN1-type zinc finger protein 4 n=1 Tax=Bonamia ostreae TaxID=126728 RepID=A0ABV2AL07_9EUKA
METNKTVPNKIYKQNESKLDDVGVWTADEIAKVVSAQDPKISEKQTSQILKIVESKDPRISNLSKNRISEKQLIGLLMDITDNELSDDKVKNLEAHQKILAIIRAEASTKAQKAIFQQCLKFATKTLNQIAMNRSKHRILQTRNFLVKKYIMDQPQILALFDSIGFKVDGTNRILSISDELAKNLESSSVLSDIEQTLHQLETNQISKTKCRGNCEKLTTAENSGYCPKCNLKRSSQETSITPKMTFCKKNCGFFGSEKTFGMCSRCYRLSKNKKTKRKSIDQKCKSALFRMGLLHWWRHLVQTDQTNMNRCWKCNKKIGFMAIRCQCRYYFCTQHRSTLDHDCPVNYKKRFEKKLLRNNPQITSEKVNKV